MVGKKPQRGEDVVREERGAGLGLGVVGGPLGDMSENEEREDADADDERGDGQLDEHEATGGMRG